MQVLTLAPSPPHRCAEAPRRARLATGHGHLQGQLVRHARPDLPGRDVPVLLSAWSRERDRVGLGEVHCAPLLCARHGARPGSWGGEMRCYPTTAASTVCAPASPNRCRTGPVRVVVARGLWSRPRSSGARHPAARAARGTLKRGGPTATPAGPRGGRGRGGESSRSAWYVSTDMCVCRANCEPLSWTKLAPSPSCERASHAPPPSSSPLSFVSPHCGDTSALILKRPRWLSQPGDDQIRQAAISPDVGSRTACR